jgi:hypothetical protein
MTSTEKTALTPLRAQKRQAEELMALWMGLTQCVNCNALHQVALPCPVCDHMVDLAPQRITIDGEDHVVAAAAQGAVPYSMYVMLNQIRLDLQRPLAPRQEAHGAGGRPMIPLMFWIMFEIMMDAFLRSSLAGDPESERLLKQPYIGGRLQKLYETQWGLTFWEDLERIGCGAAAEFLQRLQRQRNEFIHGDPQAIDDALISEVMANATATSRAWIQLFNERATCRAVHHKLWYSERRQGPQRV